MARKHTIHFYPRPKKRITYFHRPRAKLSPDKLLRSAYIIPEMRHALGTNHELREQVQRELDRCLRDYRQLDVYVDGMFRIVAGTTSMLQRLQRATGVPLWWNDRQVRQCLDFASPGTYCYYPAMTLFELGRLYFRLSYVGHFKRQDSEGRSLHLCSDHGVAHDICYCKWLSRQLRLDEYPSQRVPLANTQDSWNIEQSAAMFAWGNLRTLVLLARLAGHERARGVFDDGATIFKERIEAAMETGNDQSLVDEGGLLQYR